MASSSRSAALTGLLPRHLSRATSSSAPGQPPPEGIPWNKTRLLCQRRGWGSLESTSSPVRSLQSCREGKKESLRPRAWVEEAGRDFICSREEFVAAPTCGCCRRGYAGQGDQETACPLASYLCNCIPLRWCLKVARRPVGELAAPPVRCPSAALPTHLHQHNLRLHGGYQLLNLGQRVLADMRHAQHVNSRTRGGSEHGRGIFKFCWELHRCLHAKETSQKCQPWVEVAAQPTCKHLAGRTCGGAATAWGTGRLDVEWAERDLVLLPSGFCTPNLKNWAVDGPIFPSAQCMFDVPFSN